jgi:hypothetical protein
MHDTDTLVNPALPDATLADIARKLPDDALAAMVRRDIAAQAAVSLDVAEEAAETGATAKRGRRDAKTLAALDKRIKAIMPPADQPGISAEALADKLKFNNTRLVSSRLVKMRAAGAITMTGVKRGARYTLAPAADPGGIRETARAEAAEADEREAAE